VQAVSALDTNYDTTDEAMVGIANAIRAYYREEHPEFLEDGAPMLRETIQELQEIYKRSIFPEMKARWSAYPDNIGHLESPGCFRCHTDTMEAADGETVFTTCNKCHVILAQGDSIAKVNVDLDEGLVFVHPEDSSEMEEYESCSDCHTGGKSLYE
jgi:hypothetical protein